MNTARIVNEARAMADRFVEQGGRTVKVPVFDYDNWREVYRREQDGSSLTAHRDHSRRNFYLMHYLRAKGVEVVPVAVRADEFAAWVAGGEHDLSDGHGLAHAIGDYVNRPEAKAAPCQHSSELIDELARAAGAVATITAFGDDSENPEVLSAVLHTPDGEVLATLELLAAEMTAQQAWEKVERFLDRYAPRGVFHDRTVRRPEFCGDCNALLVNVASPEDVRSQGA